MNAKYNGTQNGTHRLVRRDRVTRDPYGPDRTGPIQTLTPPPRCTLRLQPLSVEK
jgi:hypothetical protein